MPFSSEAYFIKQTITILIFWTYEKLIEQVSDQGPAKFGPKELLLGVFFDLVQQLQNETL